MSIKEKMYAYMGGKTENEKLAEAELKKIEAELKKESAVVLKLVGSKGWKLVESYLEVRIKKLHIEMERCSRDDLRDKQAEVKAIKGLFGFLGSRIPR